ncbi:hypothetical protein MRB53_040746 [Persea americana]|nr:hypothetical protein MRB53_040746 [Persea americana]
MDAGEDGHQSAPARHAATPHDPRQQRQQGQQTTDADGRRGATRRSPMCRRGVASATTQTSATGGGGGGGGVCIGVGRVCVRGSEAARPRGREERQGGTQPDSQTARPLTREYKTVSRAQQRSQREDGHAGTKQTYRYAGWQRRSSRPWPVERWATTDRTTAGAAAVGFTKGGRRKGGLIRRRQTGCRVQQRN